MPIHSPRNTSTTISSQPYSSAMEMGVSYFHGTAVTIDRLHISYNAPWLVTKMPCTCVRSSGGYSKTNKKIGRYVPPRFSKVGSPELIFGLKLGSPEQIFTKICVSGAKILQKSVKIGIKNGRFSKKENRSGVSKAGKGLEMVELKNGQKKRSWGQHIPIQPSNNVSLPHPPPPTPLGWDQHSCKKTTNTQLKVQDPGP